MKLTRIFFVPLLQTDEKSEMRIFDDFLFQMFESSIRLRKVFDESRKLWNHSDGAVFVYSLDGISFQRAVLARREQSFKSFFPLVFLLQILQSHYD